MIVKDILGILADCSPEASVSVAVMDGVSMNIYPATSVQVLINKVDGKIKRNLVIVTNKDQTE